VNLGIKSQVDILCFISGPSIVSLYVVESYNLSDIQCCIKFQTHIHFSIVHHLPCPDLAMLDLGSTYLIGAYLLPLASYWKAWTDVDPEVKFAKLSHFVA
jgi:hypothetical protein